MTGNGWRQSMAWIHTWLGLLAGWILFAMFLTGTASYFRPEITRWMQPELRLVPVSPVRAAEATVGYLQRIAPDAQQWYIYLPDDRTVATRIFIRPSADADAMAKAAARSEIRLDPASGEPIAARDTRGGEHFYRFHFQLQLPHPWGRWLAGLAAMFMLAAILSGVITHKRIFVDFFTLRWGKGQRSWLDAHNVSAVLALPFHAMITYTGLITLVLMYMPWPIAGNYKAPAAFAAEAFGADDDGKAAGRPIPLAPIAPLVEAAAREWQGGSAGIIIVRNPNDAAATVRLQRSATNTLNARTPSIIFSGADGHRLSRSPPPGPAIATAGVMLGLHIGAFAGPVLRWTCALLGLVGTAMVGTGLLLWTAKRSRVGAVPFFGFRLVERFNIATIACLPAGMAAFLLANRLIPAHLAGRADMEVAAMYWVWFGLAAVSLALPVCRAWTATLGLATVAFAAIPLVDMATTDRGLPRAIAEGDRLFATFDLTMLALAALLGLAAWRSTRSRGAAKARPSRPRGISAAMAEPGYVV